MPNDRPTEPRSARSYWRFQLFAWGFLGGYTLLYIIANPYLWEFGPIVLDLARVGLAAIISQLIIVIALSKNWLVLPRNSLLWRGLGMCAMGGGSPSRWSCCRG